MERKLKEKTTHKTVEASEKVWLSASFKVMDIATLLLHLLSDLGKSLQLYFTQTTPECATLYVSAFRVFVRLGRV